MNTAQDETAGKLDANKNVTINLQLKRKWYWLDVNGITNKETCTKRETDGNQGSRIAGFVNIKVSVDDGANWSDWFWNPGGDDYWGTFPYGTKFQLGLHRVKDGYAYDADAAGNVAIYANGTPDYTQDTDVSLDGKTNYRVYKGTLEGEPVDKTLHDTKWGGNYHAAGSYPRYCYNVCFVDGITYYANGGTGGKEDTNDNHGPHTTFKYTDSTTLADPTDELTGCKFTAPAGKVFAGWSTTKDYTGQPLYGVGDSVSSVEWPTPRPDTSNHDTLPNKDGQTVCRTLYAIWKTPYTVKVQFGGAEGWTDWDEVNRSFPESKQHNDVFDYPETLGVTAYAYGDTSLTLSETENKTVWDALQTKISKKTSVIDSYAQPKDVWQLKDEYTFTTLPANGEVTIKIKRKRYLLNVIPALQNDDATYTAASDATEAERYGKFKLDSCGIDQTAGGKVSYYQSMRNYGNSYHIYEVVANTGYQFVCFKVAPGGGFPTQTDGKGKLTGKNTGISYFKDGINTYDGDTIYVMYKKDTVTFDFNGGKNQEGETKTKVQYFPDSYIQPMLYNSPGTSSFIGWSLNKKETPNETIYHPNITQLGNIPWPDPENKVLYARWSTGPSHAPAKKVLTVRYHANFDPNEELALDLDPNPLLEDMDDDFGFEPDPLPEDVLDPLEEEVKTVTYKPDENVVLRHCMFKRNGYVFVVWNTEPDGTGILYRVNGVPITDWAAGATVDLYAQWEKPHHLKPVDDSAPQLGGADATPTPQPGGADATPAPQSGGADATPAPQPGGMDDAFGVDPQPGGMDDAFGVDPQPEGLDDAFGV